MFTAEVIFVFAVVIAIVLYSKYIWNRRKIYLLSWKLPGPWALPILGNALAFVCKNEEILDRSVKLVSNYGSPMRLWLGPKFVLVFSAPDQVEKIMTSMKLSTKDDSYRFMGEFTGEGLITASGVKWKRDRKLMSPLFAKEKIDSYYPCIAKYLTILIDILEKQTDTLNIYRYLHRCNADIFNETIFGMEFNAQDGSYDDVLENLNLAYTLCHERMVKIWLQVEFIYQFTTQYQQQEEIKTILSCILRKAIAKAKINHHNNTDPPSFLDMMLNISENYPEYGTEKNLIDHLATLYSASEDTVTTISSFTILMLGMHPEIQEKCVQEIEQVLGDQPVVRLEDVPKLNYLRCCLNEALRLFPIAPFIIRRATGDVQIDKWIIPKNCTVIIPIWTIHRNPNFWQKPNEFYPEHFLPDVDAKRHPYTFIPFSGGIRSCIGKYFAIMALTVEVASILKKFKIESDLEMNDITLMTDISVRIKDNNFPVKLKRRK